MEPNTPSVLPVQVTCPCGQTVNHAQWCPSVPKLLEPDPVAMREREYRRLLFMAKFRLSERIGFVRSTRPDLTEYLMQLEFDRDDISDFLRAT